MEVPGKPAEYEEDEVGYLPAQIGCSLSAVFSDAKPGERIFFDDGKIEGVIHELRKEGGEPRIEVKITHAANGTAKLRAEKGINLPDTKLRISALTPKDREDLEFVTKYGDLVSLSFVRRPEDVAELIQELDRLGATRNRDHPQNREPSCRGISSADSAYGDGQANNRSDGGPRRSRGGDRVRENGGDPGGDSLDLRGGSCAGDLGDASARVPR